MVKDVVGFPIQKAIKRLPAALLLANAFATVAAKAVEKAADF
jgi:hypothetical protein